MAEIMAYTSDDPMFGALVTMIGRTGAIQFQVRYSDDETPTVWMSVATYPSGAWEVGAGPTPLTATMRLAEQVIDGGLCSHCGRASAIDFEFDVTMPDEIAGIATCWYLWDPELKTFRRSCEGEA